MEGITDAPMREYMGRRGGFDFSVSEFIRVNADPLKPQQYQRHVPELVTGSITHSGLHVVVQILGGDTEAMALSANNAVNAGAKNIDINFGCPAKTVNRHDGGATLLKHPSRIRDIVRAVRQSVPKGVTVSAKLRLGWDNPSAIVENSAMAIEGGASWLTIHARTRLQGYAPPVFWDAISQVRKSSPVPIVANGDIWTLDDFRRCQELSGCEHFMLGRGALANPNLVESIRQEWGSSNLVGSTRWTWKQLMSEFAEIMREYGMGHPKLVAMRMKQWLKLAANQGMFCDFDKVKRLNCAEEILDSLTI